MGDMQDRNPSSRAVQTAQRLLRFLIGSTHVTAFRLVWLALLFYGERAVFHNAASSCPWPDAPTSSANETRSAVHVLLVTDPRIIVPDTYPDLPFPTFTYPLVRHFSDNYLKNVWTSLAVNPNKWLYRGYIQPPSQDAQWGSPSRSGLVQPPDGVVWMGDLTDGGRRGRSNTEYEALVRRFNEIFWRPREAHWEAPSSTLGTTRQLIVPRTSANMFLPTFYLSGENDIGLLDPTSDHLVDALASQDAVERFKKHFGMKIDGGGFVVKDRNPYKHVSLNGRIIISTDSALGATHELILVNAQDLVNMQREGGGPFNASPSSEQQGELDGQPGQKPYKETYDFVESVKRGPIRVPRVLLTHVPLHRPEGTSCNDAARSSIHGVTREAVQPLQPGTDLSSTNRHTVSPLVTNWLLHSIDPMAVFSSDDHDHCEHRHNRSVDTNSSSTMVDGFEPGQIPELTVKSISKAGGIRRPGFARLSLFSPPPSLQSSTAPYVAMAYTPCLLPDQFAIWTKLYLPFLIISLVGLLLWPRFVKPRASPAGYLPLSTQRKRDDDAPPLAGEPNPSRAAPRRGTWRQDLLAVVIVALPFWVFCQTHFLF